MFKSLTCAFISIDSLRLIPQPVNDIAKVAQVAVRFEQKAFNEANDKVGRSPSFAGFVTKRMLGHLRTRMPKETWRNQRQSSTTTSECAGSSEFCPKRLSATHTTHAADGPKSCLSAPIATPNAGFTHSSTTRTIHGYENESCHQYASWRRGSRWKRHAAAGNFHPESAATA